VRVVAIRLARFGDIVLLLPALALLKARLPGSHLTFLTDARWASLAAMCPAIDEVFPIDRIGMRDGSYLHALSGILSFLRDLRRKQFDVAIDFHGFRETNLIAWRSGAARRLALKRADQSSFGLCFNLPPVIEDKGLHVSEMFQRVVQAFVPEPSSVEVGPSLIVPPDSARWAIENAPMSPYAALYVDAPVKERTWPIDRFIAVSDHFTTSLGMSVVFITAGRDLLLSRNGVAVFSNLTIPRLAAIIARARILVSNDTGPMHLGPILGVPTVGIFSVGFPQHFRPLGVNDAYVQGNPIEAVRVEEVIEAVERTLAASARLHPQY
jgi:heptosyltransferase I